MLAKYLPMLADARRCQPMLVDASATLADCDTDASDASPRYPNKADASPCQPDATDATDSSRVLPLVADARRCQRNASRRLLMLADAS